MHVCTLTHAIGHVWRSEVNLTESVLSLHHHAGPRLSSCVSIANPFMHRVNSLAPVWVLVLFAFPVRTREEKPLGFRLFSVYNVTANG